LPFGSISEDAAGNNIVEPLGGLDDYAMAVAAYWAAVENRPKDKITLRQDIRVVVKNWQEVRTRKLIDRNPRQGTSCEASRPATSNHRRSGTCRFT